ncbi:hypothetical protein [Brevibacillus laterosporus]|uniref:hypothetical protein n=1 Tax=Brevibacillus laterosporus TaxID=1465 RepID=UPI001DA2462D|nr:hypothetical protein [Brevibacillus laterosporus]MBM7108284.1 hypothetical protein [Brevibacillus laterosporus]
MSGNQVLEVKIENLNSELNSFKEETKEDIRDINLSIKQSEKLFNDAIVMTENITKLTTIADQQRKKCVNNVRKSGQFENPKKNKMLR